jgi:hypothetical protein
MICEICNSEMRQGNVGEKTWVCTNVDCERSSPVWMSQEEKELQSKIETINQQISEVSLFPGGTIKMNTVRWTGEGTFDIKFDSSEEIQIHVIEGLVTPEDERITSEIKEQLTKLIELRSEILKVLFNK